MDTGAQETPAVLFICGPVGCGNTFLFRSLLQDPQAYGVNEGNLANALRNVLNSNDSGYPCPHAGDAFATFMQALAGDRTRIIEKTPASIRHQDSLREHVPNCRFLFTIREPRAAITSALAGRSVVNDVEHVARLWHSDTTLIERSTADDLTIVYDDFVASPRPTLERISERVFPLPDSVFHFADRMARPDRAGTERWRSKVDPPTAEAIEYWVRELELDDHFEALRASKGEKTDSGRPESAVRNAGAWKRARTEAFAAYDKAQRTARSWRSRLSKRPTRIER